MNRPDPRYGFEAALIALLILGPAIATAVAISSISDNQVDVAAWIEALATLGAFIAAVIAVRYTKGIFEMEQRRDRQLDDDRRSAQASLVAAWVGVRTIQVEGITKQAHHDKEQYGYFVRNASALPVTNIHLFTGNLFESIETVETLPPGDEPEFFPLDTSVVNDFTNEGIRSPLVTLSFTDAAGHRWLRDGTAPLKRLDA